MTKKLKKALTTQKKATEQVNQQIPGLLGIPLDGQRRVEVSGRNAFVYVRLRNNTSEVIQAYNNKVAIAYNLPVLVHRVGGRYEVLGVDTQRYDNNWSSFAPFLPRHGNTHSFPDDLSVGGGGDIVWVYGRQFMPALIFPSGSLGANNVIMSSYVLKNDNGSWRYVGPTGTQSLTQYNPVTGTQAVMALVYLDSVSGNPQVIVGSGSYFSNTITGSSQVWTYVPSLTNPAHIPLAAIRLITGTFRIGWDNIYDARQWIHVTPTGSAGGAGTPAGVSGSVQYNNNGVFGGAGIYYDSGATFERLRPQGAGAAGLDFYLFGEDATGQADGGDFLLNGGNAPGSGTAGSVNLQAGQSTSGQGGYVGIAGGLALGTGQGGIIELLPGPSNLGGDTKQGFVSINDPLTDYQHRFRTSGTSSAHDYAFPDESGMLLVDAPSNGTTYGRKDKAWVSVAGGGGGAGVAVREYGSFVVTGTALDFVGMDVSASGSVARVSSLDGPQAFGYNYYINNELTGASGTVHVFMKTLAGTDPSPTDPLIFRIGNTRRFVTSAIGFSLTTGTNWFNAGSSELAGQDIDYFAYVIWEANQSAVRFGISRIPFAVTMGDFSSTSTNEKYIAGDYTSYNASDEVENIGRMRLSKASRNGAWSNQDPTISRPIYQTDPLVWTPTLVGFSVNPTYVTQYQLIHNVMKIGFSGVNDGTSNTGAFAMTMPFAAKNLANYFQYSTVSWLKDNGIQSGSPGTIWANPNTNLLTLRKSGISFWTVSGAKNAAFNIDIDIGN